MKLNETLNMLRYADRIYRIKNKPPCNHVQKEKNEIKAKNQLATKSIQQMEHEIISPSELLRLHA